MAISAAMAKADFAAMDFVDIKFTPGGNDVAIPGWSQAERRRFNQYGIFWSLAKDAHFHQGQSGEGVISARNAAALALTSAFFAASILSSVR
jgi:hypothetical protein